MLAPDSPMRNDLDQALQQLAGAAQSISSLADFLKQHPNALITGRELPKKQTMNTTSLNPSADFGAPAGLRPLNRIRDHDVRLELRAALSDSTWLSPSYAPLAVAAFTGCGFLKPAKSTARYYVLTPVAADPEAASGSLAVGLGQVKLPAYLFNTSLAVRKGTNEIDYLESAIWAERLDAGFQRVLAANLAIVLPTEQIRLSAWRSDDVAAEVYVTIEQFDVDASGRGVLIARWRILSPGGEKTLKAGDSRLTRQGPPPDTNPSGAVATLSELVAELSRQLAQVLKAVPHPA